MATQLKSLTDLFVNKVLRIPDYQRGYAWTDRELDDFWRDASHLAENYHHYTGQLTLEEADEAQFSQWDEETWLITGKKFKPYYVVDGQQRLTTALIAIKCLIDATQGDQTLAYTEKKELEQKYLVQALGVSRAYVFGYEKDNPSYEFFETQILGEPSTGYAGTRTTYTANLENARKFVISKLSGTDHADREKLFRTITQRMLFNVYELEDALDSFVVFETMNNRGKRLSRLELLKNRLIYLSTVLPKCEDAERASLRRNVNEAWKTIFEFLGREPRQPLDDDDFLRAHWIATYGYRKDEAEPLDRLLLGRTFSTERAMSGALAPTELQNYVASLQSSSRNWHLIWFPESRPEANAGIRSALERLKRLRRGASDPLLLATLDAFQDADSIAKLAAECERYIFLVARFCQRRADTGDPYFYRLAHEVFSRRASYETALASITQWIGADFSVDHATVKFKELFERNGKLGFYSWSGLKFLLYEYEQHLKLQSGLATSKLSWDDLVSSQSDFVTIEHIYPDSPRNGDWPAFDGLSAEEQFALRHSLGNLLPLSKPRNSRFSNRSFKEKREGTAGAGG